MKALVLVPVAGLSLLEEWENVYELLPKRAVAFLFTLIVVERGPAWIALALAGELLLR